MHLLSLYVTLAFGILASSAPLNGDEGIEIKRATKLPTTKALPTTTKLLPPTTLPTTRVPTTTTKTTSPTTKATSFATSKSTPAVISSPTSIRSISSAIISTSVQTTSSIRGQSSSIASASSSSLFSSASSSTAVSSAVSILGSASALSSSSGLSSALSSSSGSTALSSSIYQSSLVSSTSAPSSSSAAPSSSASATLSCPKWDALLNSVSTSSNKRRTFRVNQIAKRAVTHQSGASKMTLYHGTNQNPAGQDPSLQGKITLSTKSGDLHDSATPGVQKGFYMTDSMLAAGQFACKDIAPAKDSDEIVWILEYEWDGSGLTVKDFCPNDPKCEHDVNNEFMGPDKKSGFLWYDKNPESRQMQSLPDVPAYDQIMKDNVMITSPMNELTGPADALVATQFRQFALINQDAANDHLTYVTTHEFSCSGTVPVKDELTDDMYTATMGPSSKFVEALKCAAKPSGVFDWLGASEAI